MRLGVLVLGLMLLLVIWLGPLPALARDAFSAHMGMHMLVVAVAAPLIAIGLAGGPLDPVRRMPVLFSPILASVIELVVVWAWHAPALHHAARQSLTMLAFEQGSYLAVGLLIWLAAFGGGHRQRRQRAPTGIVGLLLTSMHMTLLGVLLALAGRPLYVHAGAAPLRLTPLQDQELGGAIMLTLGGVTYLVGALWLLAALLRQERDLAATP